MVRQYSDLFEVDSPGISTYAWDAHYARNSEAVARVGREVIEAALRERGASASTIERALKNVVVTHNLPPEGHEWSSTPANTSNVDKEVVHIHAMCAWETVRGWTGSRDVARDVLYIDGLVERPRKDVDDN